MKGIWVKPVPGLVAGDLANFAAQNGVEGERIPGYWLERKDTKHVIGQPPQPGEKVIYTLHGGGYVLFSGSPKDPLADVPRGLIKLIPAVRRAFSLEYRLSVGKPYKATAPFPAALLDALAGYNYLVNTVGFAPEDIILEGDSAGGNLALALTRYLVENRKNPKVTLPRPPGALLLLSPWADMGTSHLSPTSSIMVNEKTGTIVRLWLQMFC